MKILGLHIGIVLLMIGGSRLSCAAESMKPTEDSSHRRTALSPETNAATEWRAAELLFVPMSEEVKTNISTSWSARDEKLTSLQMTNLNQWIETNRGALALIEKSLKKDRAQIPAWDPSTPMPFAVTLINLAKARLFLAAQAARSGSQSAASKLLLGNLKLCQLLRDAEVPVIHYLIACSMRSMTEKGIVRYANCSKPEAKTLKALVSELPQLADEADAYERVLRIEFTDFILPSVDVKWIAKIWIDAARTNEFILQMQPEELRRPLLIVHDPELLALHPKPLDKQTQIRFYESRFRRYALNAHSTWDARDNSIAVETDKTREKFLKDLRPLLEATKNAKLPLSTRTAKQAARHYVNLDNPVGRYWQSTDDVLARSSVRVFQARTERAATRTILAIRLYEIQNGELPARLEDLVEAGVIRNVPVDDFANGPLRYSRAKHILWSVGEDGVNDGGVSGARFWQDKDAVWTLSTR